MDTSGSVNKIPIAGVLAILAQGAHPLAASTWRTYVSRGTAPQPASHIGVTPMWDAAVVQQWADQREEDLAAAAGVLPPARPVRLRHTATHGIDLDPTLPAYEALDAAERQLRERYGAITADLPRHHRALDRARADHQDALDGAGTITQMAGQLTHLGRVGRTRVIAEFAETRMASLLQLRDALKDDLDTIGPAVDRMLAWAKQRAVEKGLEAESSELAREWADRYIAPGAIGRVYSPRDFVLEDPRRLARSSDPRLDGLIGDEAIEYLRTADHDIALVLEGVDFSYDWHLDEPDMTKILDDTNRYLTPASLWRVSWIPETHELYAEALHENRVWLLAEDLPRAGQRQIETWLNPFERCQRQRNSLPWLAREADQQRQDGWPAIPPASPMDLIEADLG